MTENPWSAHDYNRAKPSRAATATPAYDRRFAGALVIILTVVVVVVLR